MDDFNNEVAFLRYFYRHAGSFMGPADSDIYDMIEEDFIAQGGTMPDSYRDDSASDEEEEG